MLTASSQAKPDDKVKAVGRINYSRMILLVLTALGIFLIVDAHHSTQGPAPAAIADTVVEGVARARPASPVSLASTHPLFDKAMATGEWRQQTLRAEGAWFWEPQDSTSWEPHYNEGRLCARLPAGEILIVGDSISSQSFMAFYDLAHNASAPYGSTWGKGWGDRDQEGLTFEICNGKTTVRHVRNDHLHLDTHVEMDRSQKCPYYCWDWTRWISQAGIVVMNTGTHFHQIGTMDEYKQRIQVVAAKIHQYQLQYPGKKFVFRATLPGHEGCTEYKGGALASSDSQWKTPKANSFHWHELDQLNGIARRAFGTSSVLELYEPYRRRPDNHMSAEAVHNNWPAKEHRTDCLHWNGGALGPLRYWPVFLQNFLLEA